MKLTSCFNNSNIRIIDSIDAREKYNCPVICGQVGQVDFVSPNGYRYKRGFWDQVLNDSVVSENIKNRVYLGTIEHPKDDNAYLRTPYDQASHVVLKAWVKDGNPYAILGLLNNERGNALKAVIDIGHQPGVSTRGMGNIVDDQTSPFVDSNGYTFLGWDIVTNPNFEKLHMSSTISDDKQQTLFTALCSYWGLENPTDIDRKFRTLIKEELSKIISNNLKNLQ